MGNLEIGHFFDYLNSYQTVIQYHVVNDVKVNLDLNPLTYVVLMSSKGINMRR